MTSPDPEAAPDAASGRARRWYPCCDAAGNDLVTPEIKTVIQGGDGGHVSTAEVQLRAGELRALLRRAARGELRDRSWKPVTREPALWELRWKWDDGNQIRGYFHEPSLEPDSTVLARVHRKELVTGDAAKTKQLQDAHINAAGGRIRREQHHRWGLDSS